MFLRGLDVWKCNNGTIDLKLGLNFEKIKEIIVLQDVYFVLGIEKDEKNLIFVLKAFMKNNVSLHFIFFKYFKLETASKVRFHYV